MVDFKRIPIRPVLVLLFFKQGKKKYRIRANEKLMKWKQIMKQNMQHFYYALNLYRGIGVHHLPCEFKGDSQVVLKQLEGEWPCYEDVNAWLDRIEEKLKRSRLKPKYHSYSEE